MTITDSLAPDEGIVAIDHEFRIMSCNDASRQLMGIDLFPGDILSLGRLFAGTSLQTIKAAVRAAMKEGEAQQSIEIQMGSRNEKKLLISCSVQPLYERHGNTLGVIFTFQRAPLPIEKPIPAKVPKVPPAETNGTEILTSSDLMEALPEGVFTINACWEIVSFNSRAEDITGYKREEVIGRQCWKIFLSDLCHMGCPLQTAMETGRRSMDQDVRIVKKGGTQKTILVNTGVLRDTAGQIVGAVETFRPLVGEGFSEKNQNGRTAFGDIIGQSSAMQRIFAMLPDIAASDANVLITGESGTGKDIIARTIHNHSPRSHNPYVAVNCSALAESLLESELFGHEKSAFTGATEQKKGRFEKAGSGTLFLDEIGELKPELQIKLLRILEQHEFERVGGTQTIPVKARFISATNKDLRQAIQKGQFREDFYYRLRTVPLNIPPLRERPEDIPLLVEHFIRNFNVRYNKRVLSVHPDVMEFFMNHTWPGNVRELKRTLEHAYVFVKGPVIRMQYLPTADEFNSNQLEPPEYRRIPGKRPTPERVQWALARTGGNRAEAAALLGISRTTLWRLTKEL